ncbi:MAG: hypothetical protein ACOYOO_03935 [Saprospiraceae bacterium]|jgi:hypothetical protein
MKLVINLVLVAIIAFLLYALYNSIKEPIAFKAEKERRERVVVDQLMKIRQAQEAFRDITGVFAPNFDTLSQILNKGQFKVIQVFGDPDDPNFTGEITYDTLLVPAVDSMRKILGMNNFDSLRYVPFSNGGTFAISADVIDYQSTKVPVVEVGAQRKVFMGRFADKRFARYDQRYDPESLLKFGNMFSPNLSGNWE